MVKDNSYVIFMIDKRVRFSNNVFILVSDVKFSFDMIMKLGLFIYR